tara:strand:+ start:835 stop:1044 length:210 start_codon:yes stop_codon:yes gene_type:complete
MGSFDLKFKTPSALFLTRTHDSHTTIHDARRGATRRPARRGDTPGSQKSEKSREKAYLSPQVLLVIKNN